MCGIAGILKTHAPGSQPPPPDVAIPEAWLDILDDSIKHRGPDGQGRFRDRATRPDGTVVDVAFVHRRLSIIDYAGGHQPMVSDRGPHPEKPRNARVAVVFNGCIYNHRQLRRELQSAGHRFVTDHSDTEVLIHGWREWGHELFAKLDGMFAVAIWDASSGTLVLSRDRFGEKPLYWNGAGESSVFASTVPGIARMLRPHGHPVCDNSSTWIRFGWDRRPPLGCLEPIPPGTWRQQPSASWWGDQLSCIDGFPMKVLERRSESMDPAAVDGLLRSAVCSRLEADAPLGVFLSGGLDSGLVLSYAREASHSIRSFTVRMPDSAFDESEAAAETARTLNVEHETLDCNTHPSDDLVALIRQLGLPFGDSSLLPSYWISQASRRHVHVALSGDGGDEMFLGYERHRVVSVLCRLRHMPKSILRTGGRLLNVAATSPFRSKAARLVHAVGDGGYPELLSIFPTSMMRQLVGGDHSYRSMIQSSVGAFDAPGSGGWSEAAALDLEHYLPEDLLRKTDTASMAVGLEVRAPFLARELVDRMIRVRPDVLMPEGERKGLLKQVARKYLPDSIVDRPKMGFSIPIGEWFRTDYGGMQQLLLDTLNGPDPFPEDLLGITINRRFVAQMVNDHMSRKRDHSQRLYMLLVLAIWAAWLRDINRGAAT